MVTGGTHEQLYDRRGIYCEIFDASARILNVEKLVLVDEVEGAAA